jgi:hypothetical protein
VIRAGIVEVHRALDEPDAQHADIELHEPLRLAGDGGDVMNACGGRSVHR